MKPCAIAILNWNGLDFFKKYLTTLILNTPSELATIYIIDNNSSDNSVAYIQTHFPEIKLILNSENHGFAEGYNQGLKQLKEPIYCLLNSDIEVTEHWISPILDYFEKNQKVAAIQPKILDVKDKSHFEYAGGCGGYYDRFGYAVCRGRYFDIIEKDTGQYDDIVEIFWASGCCLFVRNEVYWEVGAMDKDYFAHQEEIDLCWRINNYGYQVLAYPKSIVYHYGGGSLPYGSYFKSYLNFRNSLFNLFKNLKTYQLIFIIPIRLVLDGIAALHSILLTKKMVTFKSILFAHIAFYKSIFSLLKKRKAILHKGYPSVTSKKLILIDYYIFNCRYYSELLK